MKPFKNKGWEHYEAMQAIMFSTAARGSHIYRPAQASQVKTTIDEADDMGSETLINPCSVIMTFTHTSKAANTHSQVSTLAAIASATTGIMESAAATASMDIDHAPPPVPLLSTTSSKRSHSAMSFETDEPSHRSQSGSTAITDPSVVLDVVPKKQQKGSGRSGISRDSQGTCSRDSQGNSRAQTGQSSRAARVTPAVAMVAMQSQISQLTDVFKQTMTTPADGTAAQRSMAISRLQDLDDGLSMSEKIQLIGIFRKDITYVQVYLDLVVDEIRQAWLRAVLKDADLIDDH